MIENIIKQTIEKLKNLTQIDIQNQWYFSTENLSQPPENHQINSWQKALPNEKNYLVWGKGNKVYWLAQKITIPYSLNDYPLQGLSLRLSLTWWAVQAQIFVNNNLVQEGDLFDSSARILLTPHAIPSQEIFVCLRLISPSHDIGGLMKSSCIYESFNYLSRRDAETQREKEEENILDAGLVANELTILHNYLTTFYPEKLPILTTEIVKIDWNNLSNRPVFHQSLITLRNNLIPLSSLIKKRCFYLLSHAHLDMAWLWTTNETYQVAQRTFNSVLNLQKDFPNLTFGHTTAALYQWLEVHNPNLFNQIQQAVIGKKWEILGGMWVEPEVNLISGESLIRQLLYAQKYFKNKFGHFNKVAWLPDSFGFPWQLPQILLLAEIKYFVTGKLHWNDTSKFPYPCFWWQSLDGSKILSLMSPPNIAGVMDTNPLTMTNYAVDWEKQTAIQDVFWIPGVGDHGGGPTCDMLEVADKYGRSPFFPQLKFTTAKEYLDKLNTNCSSQLPTWNDELYLQFHRGCYTTHAQQKKFNRYSEHLLYQAELFSTLNTLLTTYQPRRQSPFPIILQYNKKNEFCQDITTKNQEKIENIWKQVLFNQFHDILPGTSIPEVFTEANEKWQNVINNAQEILTNSLEAIARYINLPKPPSDNAKPLIIFNPLNWERSEIIEIKISHPNYRVYNYDNQEVPSQISDDHSLLFLAESIPSIGYKLYWLVCTNNLLNQTSINLTDFILENEYIKVSIDQKTGNLASIIDKKEQKELLSGFGNELQLFKDEGQYWDAWNINPNYQQYLLSSPELKSIQWLDKGTLQVTVRVIKKFNQSEFTQDYILQSNSPILKIKNTVNWYENHTLLKVAFPLTINSDYVTYEIACGAIERTTKPQTEDEKAKWEVYAHNWADLSTENYGVSLLNNCKYGYDSTPNQLRLTLLRSATWPDENADKGLHNFTYALYPHSGDWKLANTVKKGYELNLPLQCLILEDINNNSEKFLPPVNQLLNLGAENLILMALKFSENDKNNLILRCYECQGENAELNLENIFNLTINSAINILENELKTDSNINSHKTLITPWQIATFSLKIGDRT